MVGVVVILGSREIISVYSKRWRKFILVYSEYKEIIMKYSATIDLKFKDGKYRNRGCATMHDISQNCNEKLWGKKK